MLQTFQKSAELVGKIVGKGIMGITTSNFKTYFLVFICLDNGQCILERIFSCKVSQMLKDLFTSEFIESVIPRVLIKSMIC